MILRHKGIRPKYELQFDKGYKDNWHHFFEPHPNGGGKYWSKRELISGCNKKLVDPPRKENLTYCKYCDEWFDNKQFKKVRQK